MNATSYSDHLHMYTDNVISMNIMFNNAISFHGLGNIWQWNTSQVTSMNGVFLGARSFNRDLLWNTSLVNDMANMFDGCISFNGNIGGWNTSRVTQMRNMFRGASVFNRNIGGWDTSSVINMTRMFEGARFFDNGHHPQIVNWNTSAVTDMSLMFRNTVFFNRNIGAWNTSRVTDMERMFENATAFNNGQPFVNLFWGFLNQDELNNFATFSRFGINIRYPNPRQTMNWEVRQVRNCNFMFNNASSFFNVNIAAWLIPRDIAINTLSFRGGSCQLLEEFQPAQFVFNPNRGR
jgi:surface protein